MAENDKPATTATSYPLILLPHDNPMAINGSAIRLAMRLTPERMAQFEEAGGRAVIVYSKPPSDSAEADPSQSALETKDVGIVGKLEMMRDSDSGRPSIVLMAEERVKVLGTDVTNNTARVEPLSQEITPELEALIEATKKELRKIAKNSPNPDLPDMMESSLAELTTPLEITDLAIAVLSSEDEAEEKSEWLQMTDLHKQLETVYGRVLSMSAKQDAMAELGQKQKDFMLDEQIENLRKQKSDGGGDEDELEELAKKIADAGMPDDAREKCEKEMKKLSKMNPMDQNAAVVRTYLEQMVALPWTKSSPLVEDIKQARAVLDADHFGLDDVKDRIIEQLAVQKKTGKTNGSIICLVGPPGVGKTSIGKSLARATGREFVRISLGGVHNEADIRGHRSTYVGAVAGNIMKAMEEAGTINPIIQLDEVDKMGQGNGGNMNGDPTAALLEVLDPAQNNSFRDHYTDVKYDLSNVMFMCSANELGNIPGPLRDRMEIIQIEGYTDEEKLEIAKRYLIPKSREKTGLSDDEFSITDDALAKLVDGYTREAGVRSLEQQVNNLARKATVQVGEEGVTNVTVTADNLEDYAGPKKVQREEIETEDRVGHVNGLYVSGMGGGLLPFEAVMFEDPKGGAVATGSLQDVMKESVQDAYDYVRSHAKELGIKPETYQKNTLHIKAGDGATPKDGPSAGLAMTTLITSVLTGIPIRADVAMTGEVGLNGQSMIIGGLKQKLLGALRAGAKTVLIPVDNVKDLADVPEKVKQQLEIIPVSNVQEVLQHALVRMPEPLPAEPAENADTPEDDAKRVVNALAQLFKDATVQQQAPANDQRTAVPLAAAPPPGPRR